VSDRSILATLVSAASAYYRGAGFFARQFARGKLGGDPVFAAILADGLLDGRRSLLDLGCGQALLATWLLAAQRCHAAMSRWPVGWPAPPALAAYRGIEINPREAARARHALRSDGALSLQIVEDDIRNVDYGTADAAVILDVLHYIDHRAQEMVLERVRWALPRGGLLLLRVGDCAAGVRALYSQAIDSAVVLARRRHWPTFQYRSLQEWQALLARCGFGSSPLPMSQGTPFANVLFLAQRT
jgi:SAM-dependent methyltransferase